MPKTSQPTLYEEFEKFGLELVSHGFLANLEVRPTLFDQIKEVLNAGWDERKYLGFQSTRKVCYGIMAAYASLASRS
jgi:hypothetical protein